MHQPWQTRSELVRQFFTILSFHTRVEAPDAKKYDKNPKRAE